tara:strand:+ start:36 stop:779 length:744 start_codon:yes stop_codon:yes gene_type:complete
LTKFSYPKHQRIDTAFVLAGGQGSRLRSLGVETPKPLLPVNDKPFLAWVFELLRSKGIERVVLSVGYKPEKFVAAFGGGKDFGLNIDYVVEDFPLYSAGALSRARHTLPSRFLFINGDTFLDFDKCSLVKIHNDNTGLATLALIRSKHLEGKGVIELVDGNVKTFIEKPKCTSPNSKFSFGGYAIIERSLIMNLAAVPSSLEYDVFPELAQNNKLMGYEETGIFIEIGTPETYRSAYKKINVWLKSC